MPDPSTTVAGQTRTTARLPQPFYDDWSSAREADAQALWHWHSALAAPAPPGSNGTAERPASFFEEEGERAAAGEPLRLLDEAVWREAFRVCRERDLDRGLLAAQVRAAARLQGRVRFEAAGGLDDFVRSWAVPHARLLAGLGEADRTWQVPMVDELARGFFYTARLVTLPADLERGRLFVPMDDLDQAGVSVDQLRAGTVDEQMRRLLWKQTVRIRDAFAQGHGLIDELPFRLRYALKRWWLEALEVVNEVERRDYDLWREPIELSFFRRLQVYLQTAFGRAGGR
jgi:phytoene synthase